MKRDVFADSLNTAVFTTRFVLDFCSPILYVHHYAEDGAWSFFGAEDCEEKDLRIISLEEAIEIDNSLLTITDLAFGWYAYRENKDSKWIIRQIGNE